MDQLIKVINKLQDAFAAVSVQNPIDLPQIVVIGSQSSGKSSVLENIVGRDILPRGTNIVTRCPLILQLVSRPGIASKPASPAAADAHESPASAGSAAASPAAGSAGEASTAASLASLALTAGGMLGEDEWAEFPHRPGQKYTDVDKIRLEVMSETDRRTGGTKNVTDQPIILRYFSPHVVTLTLVDLPGLTKVPLPDQPRDIERQLRDMAMTYITRPNAIILAVTAANTDLANSDGLKLAREVDPDGLRTVGVLTKVDLMDGGTDVTDILRGRVIPLKLGYVPVVNRGQRDIEGRKSIRQALESEMAFFANHRAYSSNTAFCGTPYLTARLHSLLLNHIRITLPDIKARIATMMQKYTLELSNLGDIHDGNASNTILAIITEFTSDFRAFLDGQAGEMSTAELNGGARIAFVFHEIFATAVAAMDPFEQIKEADIRTLLYNSSGSTPALFVATPAFELLVKAQIRRLEDPSLKCVVMIYDELLRILGQLLQKPIFRRFPALRERFFTTVVGFFRTGLDPTNKLVSQLVSAEACYINTAHPDFVSGHRAMAIVYDKLQLARPDAAGAQTPGGASGAGGKGAPASGKGAPAPPLPERPSVERTFGGDEPQGLFGSFFRKTTKPKAGVLEAPPQVLRATGSVSEREFTDIEVIKLLIQSYYSIVKETIIDMIPKCIMLNLVLYSREEMQRGLLGELYKEDLLAELLQESPDIVARRRECRKMIEALRKAEEIVATV